MALTRASYRAIGLALCGVAIVVAAIAPFGDDEGGSLLDLQRFDAVVDAPAPGGSIEATVSWPIGAADLGPDDICVVVFDADGDVVRGAGDVIAPIPGQPVAARWTVGGLADGEYTLYVAQCPTATTDVRRWVEPQYLGGAADSEVASWVEITGGGRVDVGTIALHAAGLETRPRRS